MATFNDTKNKVLSFMEQVQEAKLIKEEEDAFQNSTDYKLKVLDKCKNDAKAYCLDEIFARIYKDAVPINDDYKVAYGDDLDAQFRAFLADRCPKGIEFYVKEGLRKKNPFAKRVLEAVEDLVNKEYHDKEFNVEDYKVNDFVFKSNDDIQRKLDVISQDLAVPEIAQAVSDNVRQTAMSEITRAKKEKENLKALENQLAADVNVNSEADVKNALESADLNITKDYVPSLFNGIMINKTRKLQPKFESGELQDVYLYNTLNEFREEARDDDRMATLEELAFVETVKEYTALNILKALKLESFNKYEVADLAYEYAKI